MKKVIDFLKANRVMALATSSNENPRCSAMEYYMIGDAMIFSTSGDSIKAMNIKANNNISISVHNMPLFVTIDGCTTSPSQSEIEWYNEQLFTHHPEFRQMMAGCIGSFVYFKVVPQAIYFNDYSAGMAPAEIIKL